MKRLFLLLLLGLWHLGASSAPLTIEITRGGSGASPIAIVPFGWVGGGAGPDQDIAQIVRDDLLRSGRFQTMPVKDMLQMPQTQQEVRFEDWRIVRMDSLVIGQVVPEGRDGYMVRFQLFDVSTGEALAGYKIPTSQKDLRITAHRIADIIYEKLTGQRGAFATRIAYVTSTDERGDEQRVSLNVADADGFNSQTIVTSKKPLMSPAWSPDGSRLAYVSFEKGQPAIYVQDIYSGKRSRVAAFPGINGAPAWAPDGRRLAVTLSKDGNPDIYVLDIASGSVNPIVRHSAIDTEPAWSPDGRWIIFTSDRGGGPQIYKIPSSGGSAQRVTFEGNYNARASYAPDGKSITLLTRENGSFRIAVLDLASGSMQTLSDGPLDESPSFAPNGAMIIYATKINNKGELSAVSVDGRVRQRLALQVGDVREPVWSPFSGSK